MLRKLIKREGSEEGFFLVALLRCSCRIVRHARAARRARVSVR